MNQGTVYITAAEAGLTKWDEFKKPPYTLAEYKEAYDNAQIMVDAIHAADAAGASKIVFEKGNYPRCYLNTKYQHTTQFDTNSVIDGTTDLEIDFNGSVFFVIFDSVNRSPYHTDTRLPPYKLSGAVFTLVNNTRLNMHSFELRGDSYNRAYIIDDEKNIEQTHGIEFLDNNIDTKIDVVGHGFRGDVIHGRSTGTTLKSIDIWAKGGIDTNSGLDIELGGAYRTDMIDLSQETIYRNAIQIESRGQLRDIQFRNDAVGAFFYNSLGELIHTEKVEQSDFIYLPVNYHSIRLVAYDDERTTDTVTYGGPMVISTGRSDTATIKIHAYANHRGAVSNMCNNVTFYEPNIHDNGTLKYGSPHYADPTRYGINFENVYSTNLTINGGSISNGGQGILANCKNLTVSGTKFSNLLYSGVGVYSTKDTVLSGLTFKNVGDVVNTSGYRGKDGKPDLRQSLIVDSCSMTDSKFTAEMSNMDKLFATISNITAHNSRVRLIGNGNNLIVNNVTSTDIFDLYERTFLIAGALQANNNTVIIKDSPSVLNGFNYVMISGRKASGNLIIDPNESSYSKAMLKTISDLVTANPIRSLKGTELDLANSYYIPCQLDAGSFLGKTDPFNFEDCVFNGGIRISDAKAEDKYCDLDYKFKNCVFNNSPIVNHMRETSELSNHKILFEQCLFDLSDVDSIFRSVYASSGKIELTFTDCLFYSKTEKEIKFISGTTAHITAIDKLCKYIGVKNKW